MTELIMHYAVPSENLPIATVGIAKVAMFAFRCGDCLEDFHIGVKPKFCPECGARFDSERSFGDQI